MKDDRRHPFRDSQQDREAATHIPDTPQTRAPSYALAFADHFFKTADILCDHGMRAPQQSHAPRRTR